MQYQSSLNEQQLIDLAINQYFDVDCTNGIYDT
jgi:hypothetical protein